MVRHETLIRTGAKIVHWSLRRDQKHLVLGEDFDSCVQALAVMRRSRQTRH